MSKWIDGVRVVHLAPGGTAARSGSVALGDVIMAIDGIALKELSYSESLDLLKQVTDASVFLLEGASSSLLRSD